MPQPMELWSLASPAVATPLLPLSVWGSRTIAYEPTAEVEPSGLTSAYLSITRMAAYETKSFEELQLADSQAQYVFRPPYSVELKPTTLLERDVLRAVGDVVLNEPFWWVDRRDNAVWKRKKREIAMRVTRATLQDAAAHVLSWMAPLAREIAAENTKREDLKMSLLVDKWPTEFADATSGADDNAPPFSRQRRPLHAMPNPVDRYLVFVWAMLRGLCKRDAAAWPSEWGASSCCSCWSLRSLVDATVDRCVETLTTLSAHCEDGLDILPEDVETILLAGDDSATEWLVATLFDAIGLIRTDMVMVEMWAARHVLSLIHDHGLARISKGDSVAAPAPFQGAFIVDGVDFPSANKLLAATGPEVLEFSSDGSQVTLLKTAADSGFGGVVLEPLLLSLLPALTKNDTSNHTTASSVVMLEADTFAEPSWIGMPERPKLVFRQKSAAVGSSWTRDSPQATRVVIDVATITIPAHSAEFAAGDWHYNAPVQVMDGVEIAATAVICIDQTNVSVSELQIQSLSTQQDVGFTPSTQELYVRSAMASGCRDTNAGIVGVPVHPGRAVILPPTIQYRITNTALVDASQPGSFVVLRIALVSPKCTTPSSNIEAMLQKMPETPEWLEDLLLRPLDKNASAEEARFAHYQQDQQPGVPIVVVSKSSYSFATVKTRQPRPDTHILERKVLHTITELMNAPQWWVTLSADGSASRREWEQELERLYLHERLQSEVVAGYTNLVKSLSAQVKKQQHKRKSQYHDDSSNSDDVDAFAEVAKLFSRIVMLREVHQGFTTDAKPGHGKSPVQVVVDLVQQCRNAASVEAQAQIISDFIGPNYPVETLLTQVAGVLEGVNDDVTKWMKRVVSVVDGKRLALLQEASGELYSPTKGTCALDGAVAQVVKADLVAALEPLLIQALSTTANSASMVRLVDPMCPVQSSRQTLPLFSVPRIGSIDTRLAAIIVQKLGGDRLEWRVSQWIPSEVAIDCQGNARFLTYISNVFPRAHRGLYKTIDVIATAFVPLFEKLLSDLCEPTHGPFFWNSNGNIVKDEDTNVGTEPNAPGTLPLLGRVVQMVVEIVQIDLNPERSRYSGDGWHRNETKQQQHGADTCDVLATGVYFARVDNVTLPRIMCRETPKSVQPLDFVDGYEDRCLVFSNEFEHKMEACELVDDSRSGTVLMLKLHLIDPEKPTVSTANVQPTQRDWVVDFTLGDVSCFFNLPSEVHDVIESMLEWDGLRPFERNAPSNTGGGFGAALPTTNTRFGAPR